MKFKRINKADRNRVLKEEREMIALSKAQKKLIELKNLRERRREVLLKMGTNPKNIESLLDELMGA